MAAGEVREPMTREAMRRLVAGLLDDPATVINDDDDLIALGIDSLRIMRLVAALRRQGVEVAFGNLIERPTLAAWWQLAAADQAPTEAEPPGVDPPVDESLPFELATMQHAYWVGRADGQPLGGVSAHFYAEFDGRGVSATRLERAVHALIARHGMLRARFLEDGRQHILPESAWQGVVVHDLHDLPTAELEQRLGALRADLSHRRLAVEHGHTLDVHLSLLPAGATRLHLHIEMLVADAISFRLLLAELARLYEDPHVTLPSIDYSYPRYLADQATRRTEARARARTYWHERLAELPGPPELPLAVDPTTLEGHHVTRLYRWLGPDEWQRLAASGREHGLTLSLVLMTAFAEVLAAWSTQPRMVLNLPLYDRDETAHPDVARLVGDFTNLLVLAVDASDARSFVDRARQIQARFQADVAHLEYSGVDVLRDLGHTRGTAQVGAPVVFTSALSMGELFGEHVRRVFGQPGWTMSQTPQVWLDCQVTERESGLYLNWDAVEGLFAEGTLEAMFGAYSRLLDWLMRPDTDWLGPLASLLPPEQAARRAAVNATDGPESGQLLHEGFFAQAAEHPERLALAWGDDGQLSYGELAQRALRVTGLLQARGVRPAEPIALTLAKGPLQVAAVLGVLAAGAVYVPVGLDQPASRRARVYRNAGIRYVLSSVAERDALEWPTELTVLAIEDAQWAVPAPMPLAVWDESLAYVLYTSGSTGEPKGVMMTHRAAMNTLDDLNHRFAVGPADRALAVSALDFDLSVYDTLGLLACGGAVVMVEETARADPEAWARLVDRFGVTVLNCVPAVLEALLDAARPGQLGSLRLVLLGGDWVRPDLVDRVAAARPDCRFVALGGTTETAIHSTVCEVVGSPPANWRSVPYGTPLRNVRCRVADARGRDCPDWVAGELWIGGRGVAQGYRGDPERTARHFIERDGERWYRTGDLARYWPDGSLEFLGRADLQVKIRGYRIELGEIEAAIESHPGVKRAVAVAVGAHPPRLVAAVAAAERPPSLDELRSHLTERLPAYMLPEWVAIRGRLPLNANGKIDRGAIRELLAAEKPEPVASEPPRGRVEEIVAQLWTELLGCQSVDRTQSFFALGGDSLLATRVIARLGAAGIGGAKLKNLFAHPALKDFAATLVDGLPGHAQPGVRPDLEQRYEPFPATDVQRAYWLGRSESFTLGGVGSHWYWEFDGVDVEIPRLEAAWRRLVERHEMLRAVIDDDGRQRILRSVPAYVMHVTDIREGDDAVAALEELRAAMSHQVFDVSRWPLFDIRAVRYGRRMRIAFGFDYIVVDALSIMIVLDELGQLYADPGAELPPLRLSFRDYLLSPGPAPDATAAAREFWSACVDGLPPPPQLPLAIEPARVSRPRFTRRSAHLPAEQWRALVARARAHDLTPAAALATAYAEVLAAWSSQPELTLTCTLFDRREVHPDIYRIVGDFTSLLLVAHRPRGSEPWVETARRLQHALWEGMEHRAVSAVWVLRELARRTAAPEVSMPVVFTSALGVRDDGFELRKPFGEYVWGVSQTPQVWLDLQVMERDGGLAYNWDAVEELFPSGVLDALFEAFGGVLAWLAAPGTHWRSALPPLLPRPQASVRAHVNASDGPVPEGRLQDGFFDQAARSPQRIALAWGESGQLTYGELAERARRVGGLLAARGLAPGEPVLITLPRGPEQVASVLGVLYAGGVYVPVGPAQPSLRRERILRSAGVRFALTNSSLAGDGGWPTGTVVLTLDDARAAQPLEAPVAVAPDALAYIIYTSGSTGEPKGVMVTHRAALNTIVDVSARFSVGASDRVLAVSALDFDLSVYDIFGLLGVGGALVLPGEDEQREARRWAELVARWGVTLWNSVPVLLDMLLVAAGSDNLLKSLRLALVSGDWVGLDLAGRLSSQAPRCRLVALGGATEAGIWSNFFEVGAVPGHWRSVPYGRPLRNQRFRVVDARGRDCPDWVAGELWIGGAGVASGYRGDPDATRRAFVEHAGHRWYRTGDLGRYWTDGTLEFLGRADQQVKLGGHRVELGEVEAVLSSHPDVADAVAVVTATPPRKLSAFVVPTAASADPTDLRSFLAGRLPTYMLPASITSIPHWPLTSNGKLDRSELARRAAATDGDPVTEPPRGATEVALGRIWSALLERREVGRTESFFALGGDSLLATRLVDAVRRQFHVDLPLRAVFAAPTIAELADMIVAPRPPSDDVEEGVV